MQQATELVIFGADALGQEVAAQLQGRRYQLLMVDNDEDHLRSAQGRGLEAIRLDYTDDEALRRIGIGDWVKTIFCLFPDDARNVFLTISARGLDPELRIVTITQAPDSRHKLLAAGADKVIDFYEISATRIYELIKSPLIVETLERTVFSTQDLDLAEVPIPEGSFLTGLLLPQFPISRRYNLILLGVVDQELGEQLIFTTQGQNHRLDPGDILVVIGPLGEIGRLRQDVASLRPPWESPQ